MDGKKQDDKIPRFRWKKAVLLISGLRYYFK